MTDTLKAPRKRAAKPRILETPEAKAQIRENAAELRTIKTKAGAIHPDARIVTADGKRKRLTALDKARLIICRAQAPIYAVRGRLAGWLLSCISPFALTTATHRVAYNEYGRPMRHVRVHSTRPVHYSLHHGKKRTVRFSK